MNEHTPGPWHVRETPESSHQDFTVEAKGNVSVASLYYQRGGADAANARLIAAAPDLYRALRDLLVLADEWAAYDAEKAPIIAARAALAKAVAP